MVDKILVETIDENVNKNPNVIKFILKIGKSYDYVLNQNKRSIHLGTKTNVFVMEQCSNLQFFSNEY
jgi:hypothetical protein